MIKTRSALRESLRACAEFRVALVAAILCVASPSLGLAAALVVQRTDSTTTIVAPDSASSVEASAFVETAAKGTAPSASSGIKDSERVIVRLRGAALARRTGGTAAARTALGATHTRVKAEIQRLLTLRGRAATNAIRREFFTALNGFAAALPRDVQQQLLSHPDVIAIDPDYEVHAIIDPSIPLVEAPTFWASHGNYRGAGTVIAVVDTGVDYTHADLGGCTAVGPMCKVQGGFDFVNDDADPRDDNGHGTHVAATAAGADAQLGVAPDAMILAYKVLGADGTGFTSDVIAGIDRAIDPNQDGNPADHADVINLSVGGPGNPDDPGAQAVDAATAVGIVVVAAAGNSGASGFFTIESPGCARTAVTVGATDDSDQLASFSSRGPSDALNENKPDLTAPGVGVCAARAAGTTLGPTCVDATHIQISGTSMATPHVAGAAALLRGVFPSLTAAEIKSLIVDYSQPLGLGVMTGGAGRLDVAASAQAHSVITPVSLSYGQDDLSQSEWTLAKTLTVRNFDASTRSYTLTVSGPPAGTSLVVSPSSFTLAPGASATVTATLTVNNNSVPPPTSPPFTHEGVIQIQSGTEVAHVPWAFIDAAVLRVHFDAPPYIVRVHDRTPNGYDNYLVTPGSDIQLAVPPGTYDVMMYSFVAGVSAFVVHEGVTVTTVRDESLAQSEAIYDITLAGHNETGQVIGPAFLSSVALSHRASNRGFFTITLSLGSPSVELPVAIKSNGLSNQYSLALGALAFATAKEYVLAGGSGGGISASRSFDNTAEELTRVAVRYESRPGDPPAAFGSDGIMALGFGSAGCPTCLLLPAAFDLYTQPLPYAGYPFYVKPDVYDPSTVQALHFGPLVQAAEVAHEVATFDLWGGDPILHVADGDSLPLNVGPATWIGRMTNYGTGFTLTGPSIAFQNFFRSQAGDSPEAPSRTVPYRIRSGSSVIQAGTLPHGQSFTGAANPGFAYHLGVGAPGRYTFEVGDLPYSIGGVGASTRVEAEFGVSLGSDDVNPPSFAHLTLASDGQLTDVVPLGGTVTLGVDVQDEALAGVAISYVESGQLISVPLTPAGGSRYQVTLPGLCLQPGTRALVLSAVDTAGNTVSQFFTPAFVCRAASCGNGTVDAGEACDDGNLVSGDACNVTCSGPSATCGNTVLDPGEACDDGNNTPGDGCSATCGIESGYSCGGSPVVCAPFMCGNGAVEPGEQCDDGNTADGDCCSSTCQFEPTATVCRPATGECDVAETCTGSNGACPANLFVASGTFCSNDGNVCTNDQCNGSGACIHPNNTAPCDDGLFCNGSDTCSGGSCSVHAGDPCIGGAECATTCNEVLITCNAPTGTACTDDGQPCTNDACDGAGACQHIALPDTDGDSVCDAQDTCTNVGGARDFYVKSKLILTKINTDTTPGNDGLKLSAAFDLPSSSSFSALDPIAHGARIVLLNQAGGVEVDQALPGGAYTGSGSRGWKVNTKGTVLQYLDKTASPLSGITTVKVSDKSTTSPGHVTASVTAKKATYPVVSGDQPLQLVVVLGNQTDAIAGYCGESDFTPTSCGFNGAQNTLICRQ